jgi:hypothetical protein
MRRLTVSLAIGLTIAAVACKRSPKPGGAGLELLSVVRMDDSRGAAQLLSGFYSPEDNSWRWTAGKFSAELKPPPGASQNGAKLELKLTIPDVVVQQLGAITLSASAGGARLTPEKFTEAGNYVYAADVPASALGSDSITVEFSTDKAIPPGKVETRELGLIVTSVGLVPR